MLMLFYTSLMCVSLVVGVAITLRDRKQRLLGFFCLINGAYQGLVILDAQTFYISPKSYFLILSILFLPGPLLLGYVAQFSSKVQLSKRDFMCFFIPTIMVLLLGDMISKTGLFSLSSKSEYTSTDYIRLYVFLSIILGLHTIFYTLYSSYLVYQYRNQWHQLESGPLPQNWYKMVLTLFFFAFATAMQVASAIAKDGAHDPHSFGDFGAALWLIYLNTLAIRHLLKQSSPVKTLVPIDSFPSEEKDKPHRQCQSDSADSPSATQHCDSQLQALSDWVAEEVESNKIYLDNDLSLRKLAEKLQIKPYLLSESLNKGAGQSFYQFINHYRVNEAKEILIQRPDISITDVYEFCGFSSRSTFYSLFRKSVGCTPAQYRKSPTGLRHKSDNLQAQHSRVTA